MMKSFLKKANQSNLLFDILLVLGVFLIALSLANYFGRNIDAIGFGLGWISCVLLFLAIKVMEFFTLSTKQLDSDHHFLQQFIPGLSPQERTRPIKKEYSGLILLLILVSGWAILQFVMLQMNILSSSNLIWLLLIAVFAMFLGMPGLQLVNSGYAELVRSMLIFGLLPVYAYQVITGEYHIMISLMAMPMALFYLSLQIGVALSLYAVDQVSGRMNLLQRLGWKQGMFFHNLFILLGFVSYACIPLFGYPARIFLNPVIVLPFGLVLIFMLYRIEHGRKPEWGSLIFLEKILSVLVFYFLFSAMILQ